MKLILKLFFVVSLILCLVGCSHTHEWKDATCTTPKTCSLCNQTEGEALGHDWKEATCIEAKTCSRCSEKEGSPAGHDFQFERKEEATCSKAGYSVYTCSRCNATEIRDKISALGHEWQTATCTEPKTCSRCGRTEGSPAGHNAPDLSCTQAGVCLTCGEEQPALGHDWKDATCTEPRTCTRCGMTEGDALGHTPGDLKKENEKPATCTAVGSYDEVVYCSVCRAELSRNTIDEEPLGHTVSSGKCSRCGAEIYEPITGSGDDVVSDVNVGEGLYRVHITNSGDRYFSIWVYDKDEDKDLAANEVGSYDGYHLLEGNPPYTFEISSHGNWTLTVEKIPTTSAVSFEGLGDYVTDIFPAKSGTWHITHNGERYFSVWLYTTDGRDLLVNEIGQYDGNKRVSIPTGSNALLIITADGEWTIGPAS